jgi:hypothetical protein
MTVREAQQPHFCLRTTEAMIYISRTTKLNSLSYESGESRVSAALGVQDYGRFISRMGPSATSKAPME